MAKKRNRKKSTAVVRKVYRDTTAAVGSTMFPRRRSKTKRTRGMFGGDKKMLLIAAAVPVAAEFLPASIKQKNFAPFIPAAALFGAGVLLKTDALKVAAVALASQAAVENPRVRSLLKLDQQAPAASQSMSGYLPDGYGIEGLLPYSVDGEEDLDLEGELVMSGEEDLDLEGELVMSGEEDLDLEGELVMSGEDMPAFLGVDLVTDQEQLDSFLGAASSAQSAMIRLRRARAAMLRRYRSTNDPQQRANLSQLYNRAGMMQQEAGKVVSFERRKKHAKEYAAANSLIPLALRPR